MTTKRQAVKAATKKNPPPSRGTKTVVKKGDSARMARGREAKKKVEENKAKVDALNERERARARAAAAIESTEAITIDAVDDAKAQAAADARKQQLAAGAPTDVAIVLGLNGIEWAKFLGLAEAEYKAVRDAKKQGKKPPKETPNYDLLVKVHSFKKEHPEMATKKATKNGGGTRAISPKSARLTKADEARKKAKDSPPNTKTLDDGALYDYIVKVQKAHPNETLVTERRYARFVEGIKVSTGRWGTVWEAASKGKRPTMNGTAAKAPAKKAPAKKTAARKQVQPRFKAKKTARKTPARKTARKTAAKRVVRRTTR